MVTFNNVKFYAKEETDNEATFIMEPLPQGYGMTVGNAMRRVLLSSIGGAAITSVKIDGVLHEFSTIEGMKEDVVELVLNLKKVRVKLYSKNATVLTLNVKGPKQVTAKDINKNVDAEVINGEQVLATIQKGGKLKAELTVESGVGYVIADSKKTNEVGVIPIDAIYTPVQRVDYRVQDTRVGQQTNFDQLSIKISTDGTIKPREALKEASTILTTAFSMINGEDREVEETDSLSSPASHAVEREVLVDELGLETRIVNSLHRAGIETVNDLIKKNDDDLANIKNLGEKSLNEIKTVLAEYKENSAEQA